MVRGEFKSRQDFYKGGFLTPKPVKANVLSGSTPPLHPVERGLGVRLKPRQINFFKKKNFAYYCFC